MGLVPQGKRTKFEADYAQFIGTSIASVGLAGCADLDIPAYIDEIVRAGDEMIVGHTYIATILAITESGLVRCFEPKANTLEIDDDRKEGLHPAKRLLLCICMVTITLRLWAL